MRRAVLPGAIFTRERSTTSIATAMSICEILSIIEVAILKCHRRASRDRTILLYRDISAGAASQLDRERVPPNRAIPVRRLPRMPDRTVEQQQAAGLG